MKEWFDITEEVVTSAVPLQRDHGNRVKSWGRKELRRSVTVPKVIKEMLTENYFKYRWMVFICPVEREGKGIPCRSKEISKAQKYTLMWPAWGRTRKWLKHRKRTVCHGDPMAGSGLRWHGYKSYC